MIRTADLVNYDTDYSISSSVPDSDFSDNYSEEGTLSTCNSIERLKLTEGHVEENFRVDRRKLEAMVLGCPPEPWDTEVMKIPIDEDGRVKSAADFFEEIMTATNTLIKYPNHLKTDAKNKKDPHVRVLGLPEAVNDASQRIRYVLQPQNRITMKMDVPWTCHSHIIGKGGNTIQPVVKRTGVSIHFPDGNKNSELHKSNQVSINSRGEEVTGLEEARSSIRSLTPLKFTFTLPATAQFISILDPSLLVVHVQNMYNVQAELQLVTEKVLFGSVKGTDWDATRVKEATLCLLQALCGNLANQMTVQMTVEVSPHHHSFILGRNKEGIKKIMHRTATKITFPDSNDPMLSPLNRSTITICGAIDNVYLARQNIIGSLPLVLHFDILPDQTLDQREMNQVMQTLDVCIIARNKRIDGKRSVVIKGAERNASNIYEAWRMVTKCGKPAPQAKIPPSYILADASPIYGVGPCLLSPIICNSYSGFFDNVIPDLNTDVGCYGDLFCNDITARDSDVSSPSTGTPITKEDFSLINLRDSFCEINNNNVMTNYSEVESLINLIPDRRAPGCEKKQAVVSEYITKKMLAAEVMKRPVLPEPRIPTSTWSGYGLSKSGPAFLINQLKREEKPNFDRGCPEWSKISSGSSSSIVTDGSSSQVLDDNLSYECNDSLSKPKPHIKPACSFIDSVLLRPHLKQLPNDINSILVNLQMEQYIDLFAAQDIDTDTFCSLTDEDLKDLGVTSFGQRRKLLMTIKNLCVERQGRTQHLELNL